MEADSLGHEKWTVPYVVVCMAQHAGREVGHSLVNGAFATPETNKSVQDG
jgi:hypothetical protein